MIREKTMNHSEYQRIVALLSKLFEFESDIEKQIYGYIGNYGICHFLENLEAFELSVDTIIKLQALKSVLFGLDKTDDKVMRGGSE